MVNRLMTLDCRFTMKLANNSGDNGPAEMRDAHSITAFKVSNREIRILAAEVLLDSEKDTD